MEITLIKSGSSVLVADKDGFVKTIIPREDKFKKDIFPSWDGQKVIVLE